MISNVRFNQYSANANQLYKNQASKMGFGSEQKTQADYEAEALKARDAVMTEQGKLNSAESTKEIPANQEQIVRERFDDFFQKNAERQAASGQEIF